MLHLVASFIVSLWSHSLTNDCPTEASPTEYHLSDVCDPLLEGTEAFSATFRASLTPKPASQQVMVYKLEDRWFIRIAGFNWNRDEVVTRRRDLPISESDAEQIADALSEATLERLGTLSYYGNENRICMDGASVEIAMSSNGQRYSASQHTCAGETELSDLAAAFRNIAVKYDPASSDMLDGLKSPL